jgi:hypothetical protein
MVLSSIGPLHPTWTSLNQLLMMIMSRLKFSIPSLNHLKLVMTFCNIKYLIYFNMWSHNAKYLMRKEIAMGNCITCFAHQIRRFLISTGHTTNCRYNCNSFLKVDMITSSFDIIYPKNKSSFSITIGWFANVSLTRFEWKYTH